MNTKLNRNFLDAMMDELDIEPWVQEKSKYDLHATPGVVWLDYVKGDRNSAMFIQLADNPDVVGRDGRWQRVKTLRHDDFRYVPPPKGAPKTARGIALAEKYKARAAEQVNTVGGST